MVTVGRQSIYHHEEVLRQASMNLGCESHSLVKKMKEMGASQNLNEYLFTVDDG